MQDEEVHGPNFIRRRPRRSLGDTLHEALAEAFSGSWVSRDVWPYCHAAKEWLDKQGVNRIEVEQPIQSNERHGVCDVLAFDRNNARFVLDWKYANSGLPTKPKPENVFQLGLYGALARGPGRISGAIAYIAPRERKIRIFNWADLSDCAAEADRLAA